MADGFSVSDYSVFETGSASTNALSTLVDDFLERISQVKYDLQSDSNFMGPLCDYFVELLSKIENNFSVISSCLLKIDNTLSSIHESYLNGDEESLKRIQSDFQISSLSTKNAASTLSGNSISGNISYSTEIPSDINQSPYTVTCYGVGGFVLGGTQTVAVAPGTNEEAVHNTWVNKGAYYKNGIAMINQDGVDYYLVAVSETFGSAGDKLKVNFDDGSSINCIVADSKSSSDSNYDYYGHRYGNEVNILEFEVNKDYYLTRGNPTTASYGLDWNSNSKVTKIDNYGSIF